MRMHFQTDLFALHDESQKGEICYYDAYTLIIGGSKDYSVEY